MREVRKSGNKLKEQKWRERKKIQKKKENKEIYMLGIR